MLLLCCLSVVSWGQKDKWMLYPNKVDFDAGPGFSPYNFSTPSPSLGVPYLVENSVFGTDGELYFYIQDGCIYDKNGALASCFADDYALKKEIGIAPVPGQCRTYCIFFMETFPLAQLKFSYVEVIIDEQSGLPSFISNPILADGYGSNNGSLAVSQAIEGTGGERYIYVAVNSTNLSVHRYRMTATSVVSEGVVATLPSGLDKDESEVEISPCNSHLAWSSGGTAYVLDLQTGQQYSLNLGPRPFSGLEFSASSGCRDLILSHQAHGIVAWRYAQGQHLIIPGTEAFNKTQIERVKDGEDAMYLVKDGGDAGMLWRLQVDGFVLQPVIDALPVYSNASANVLSDIFALPDQIDGEGDDAFFGVPPLYLTGLGIDGAELPASHTAAPAFYNCGPIGLDISYEGTPDYYSIGITSVNPANGEPIYGAGYLDFLLGFAGPPPAAIDLRCLGDPALCDLFDGYEGQVFLITVVVSNRCGYDKTEGYFKVFGPPADVTDINLQVVPGNTIFYCPASPSLSMPCPAGVFSGSIDFTNANGDVGFYRVRIWDVDCFSGAESLIYDGGEVAVNGVGDLAPLGLNSFEINGSTGHFALNGYLNQCIRVAVEVGNACGSVEDFTYIRFDGNYFGDDDVQALRLAGGSAAAPSIKVYPNPFKSQLTIELASSADELGELLLFSSGGQAVCRQAVSLAAGFNRLAIELPDLPAGVYFYRLRTAHATHSGSLARL